MHGFTPHNNLFEGNMGRDLEWDGRSEAAWNQYQGMFNTAYRNRLTAQLNNLLSILDADEFNNRSHYRPSLIGNLTNSLLIESGVIEPFAGANWINGTVVLGNMPSGSTYPASLYETEKPSFFGTKAWPVFGPAVTNYGNTNTIPAFDRAKVNTQRPN